MIDTWVRLWSHREAPSSLAVLRIVLPLMILTDLLVIAWLDLVPQIFGAAEVGGFGDPVKDRLLVYQVLPPTVGSAWLIWAVTVGLCLAASTGTLTPLSLVLLVIVDARVADLFAPGDRAIDRLIRNVLLILACSGSHRTASVDARWRTGSFWGDGAPVTAWPRHLIAMQIVVMYFEAGITKVGVDWTPFGSFSALWYAWQDPALSRIDVTGHEAWLYPISQVSTAVTITWEISAPFVLLVYWLRHTHERGGRVRELFRRWRPHWMWLGVGVVMHVGIALTFGLGIFPWAMLASYAAFVHPDEWRWPLSSRRDYQRPASSSPSVVGASTSS